MIYVELEDSVPFNKVVQGRFKYNRRIYSSYIQETITIV